jgi:hypothetical protein
MLSTFLFSTVPWVVLSVESSNCYADFDRLVSEVHPVLAPAESSAWLMSGHWTPSPSTLQRGRRKKALYGPGSALCSEEDVSGQAFETLKSENGLVRRLGEADDR